MIEYILASIVGAAFVLFAHHLVKGDTAMNMISSLILVCLLLYLLPELRSVPVGAYFAAWALAFCGMQFAMPWAAGQPVGVTWGQRRFVLAEIITS